MTTVPPAGVNLLKSASPKATDLLLCSPASVGDTLNFGKLDIFAFVGASVLNLKRGYESLLLLDVRLATTTAAATVRFAGGGSFAFHLVTPAPEYVENCAKHEACATCALFTACHGKAAIAGTRRLIVLDRHHLYKAFGSGRGVTARLAAGIPMIARPNDPSLNVYSTGDNGLLPCTWKTPTE